MRRARVPLILIFCCQLYICGTRFDITDTFRLLARFKILQMHHAQRLAYSGLKILRIFSRAQAERNVFKHRHMRPERKILKHKAKASLFRRQIDSLLPGKYARAVKINLTRVRRFQARNHPQKRRLSAAGRAKERRKAAAFDCERCRPYDLLFFKTLCDVLQSYFHAVPLFCTSASIPELCKARAQQNVKSL